MEKEQAVKKKKKNKWFYNLLLVLFAGVFLVSGGILIHDIVDRKYQDMKYKEMSDMFETVALPAPDIPQEKEVRGPDYYPEREEQLVDDPRPIKERYSAETWKTWWQSTAVERYPVYRQLHDRNRDVIGWIHIEGTVIDYPVCQSVNDPEYYLHHDINHWNSGYGTPFMDSICRVEDPRSSLLIYGHHMKNGSMFASLDKYREYDYYLNHPYIQFDTLDEAGTYEVAAVFRLDAEGTQVSWQQLLFPSEQKEFTDQWSRVQRRLYYDTGVNVKPEDEILALVTCEYTQKNGRLMVIARRVL